MKKRIPLMFLLPAVFFAAIAAEASSHVALSAPASNQAARIASLNEVVSLSGPGADKEMLQFKAGGHVLGFQRNKAYLAGLDHALSAEFLGTPGVMPQAAANGPAKVNMPKAPPLRRVVYQGLWRGVSLTYESTIDGITESTYHISPGADVSRIRLRYNVPVELQKDGSLRFHFERGYLTESSPVAWQEIGGKRVPVKVAFRVSGGEVGFSVGKYEPGYPLTIDPTYAWHTFYGSSDLNYGNDLGTGIVVDGSGNVYVTGDSGMPWNGPSGEPPLNAHTGWSDIFVLKLNASGAYQWHTFYGSNNNDGSAGIALDSSGNVYVAGWSELTWGTPRHAFSEFGQNLFVLKLNSDGAHQWHTFYGTSYNNAISWGVAVHGNDVYVSGSCTASWGTPLNPFNGVQDIFVLKLNSDGDNQWHTYYGSSGDFDFGEGIAVDGAGGVYVTGQSLATWNGPSGQNPLNGYSGGGDIFVLKLNSSGTYQWHSFFGSIDYDDYGKGIAVDGAGYIYVTGFSNETWGAPINPHSGASDVFVLKLNSSGAYQWHTFFGSPSGDDGTGIAVDSSGNVYVTGTYINNGGFDIFVLKLNTSGAYQWHRIYGAASAYDHGYGIAVDGNRSVYVTGESFATWGTPLHGFSGLNLTDIVVLKLNITKGDFNGDGNPDILWRNASTGQNLVWYMNGTTVAGTALIDSCDLNWKIVGTGDFNNDGRIDILWRDPTTGQNLVWLMNGTTVVGTASVDSCDPNWEIVGTGDFNGDSKTDILWRHPSTGQNLVWLMNGTTVVGTASIDSCDLKWKIVGIDDFNGDGKTDILWRNPTTGQNLVWYMNRTAVIGPAFLDSVEDANWEIVGTGDFNGDSKTDIIWRNPTTGQNLVWYMNGTTVIGPAFLDSVKDANWKIVGR
jgi:hypothetical protein